MILVEKNNYCFYKKDENMAKECILQQFRFVQNSIKDLKGTITVYVNDNTYIEVLVGR
jgi:hypothetical protein